MAIPTLRSRREVPSVAKPAVQNARQRRVVRIAVMVTATALMVAIAMRPSTAAVRKDPVGSRSLRASDRVKLEAQQRINWFLSADVLCIYFRTRSMSRLLVIWDSWRGLSGVSNTWLFLHSDRHGFDLLIVLFLLHEGIPANKLAQPSKILLYFLPISSFFPFTCGRYPCHR